MSPTVSSNVVEHSWKTLHMTKAAHRAVLSSVKIVFLFALLFLDMSYSVFSGLFSLDHPFFWFIELSVAVLLLFQIISNGFLICRYFWTYLFGSAVDITEEQRLLMAIPVNDRSFRTPQKTRTNSQPSAPLTFSHSPSYSPGDSPQRFSGSFTIPSPNRSAQSPMSSSPMSPYASVFNSPSFNASYNSSFDKSLNLSGLSTSSNRFEYDRKNLRSRRSASVPVSPSSFKYRQITDVDTLNQFIVEEETREMNKSQASPENLNSGNLSFWAYGSNPMDFTHILRRFAYQIAPRSLASPALASASDQTNRLGLEEVWNKYNVTEDDLYVWTERLRKWLSCTIVDRLSAEIDEVNTQLRKIGCDDDQIGKVGVSTLRRMISTKWGNSIPTLNSVITYLDFTANQEYLCQRIKDLSTGCMSAYTWNKGGNYGKPWSEHLPTDAAIVMQLFCCYLNCRLPAQLEYTDGKPFSSQHFLKTPDKPNIDKKDNLQIFQSTINPPHFQVVIGSQTYNLSRGRNNMFQAILLFLYHIKVKESGMLGRVNLGLSGLNILWIFD